MQRAYLAIVLVLALIPAFHQELTCVDTAQVLRADLFCLNTVNPVVWYKTSVADDLTETDGGVVDLYNQMLSNYSNVQPPCSDALKELACTLTFTPCIQDTSRVQRPAACNSTSMAVVRECGYLPVYDSEGNPFNPYTSFVDNADPLCAFAFEPVCAARTIVRAGGHPYPYAVTSNNRFNFNITTECDIFSYQNTSDPDRICTTLPAYNSPCTGGNLPSWYYQYPTTAVECIGDSSQVYTNKYKRNGDPCNSGLECVSTVCTNNTCVEPGQGENCTMNPDYGIYSCQEGFYCENSICVPMKKENEECGEFSICEMPLTCVTISESSFCKKPAGLGESCSRVDGAGSFYPVPNTICGPNITSIESVSADCIEGTCSLTYINLGDPCLFGNLDAVCNPLTSKCNGTESTPNGYCAPPEQFSCSLNSNPCTAFQYCDCPSGVGQTGVCRTKQDHPWIGCQNEYVELFECLRSKCHQYPNAGFVPFGYYPFDGYSCGDTKCMRETRNVYCCTVELNGGVGLDSINYTCPGTPTPTPTAAPTTTEAATTTLSPTTTTEVPTPTAAPTTTAEPTTTTSVPTTTEAPTTLSPTTTTPSSTTAPPTTAAPTTSTPTTLPATPVPQTTTPAPTVAPTTTIVPTTQGPTSAPVSVISSATITLNVTGDISQVPPPVVNNSIVLYSSVNVTTTVPLSFVNTTVIPKDAIVQKAQVTFTVTYIEKKVTVLITLTDEYGDVAGSVRAEISTNGTISVDIGALYAQILAENQKSISIRAIRGAILSVSISIETQNVEVNLDPSGVTSTIIYSVAETPAATTTTIAPTTVPTTTKQSLSTASSNELLYILILCTTIMCL